MRTKLLGAVCALLLVACGKNAPHAPSPAAPAAAQPAVVSVPPRAGALKIKDFYIGMNIHDVADAMIDLLAEHELTGYGFTEVIRYSSGEQCQLLYDKRFLEAIESRMHERYTAQIARAKIEDALQSACYNSDGVVVVKAGPDARVDSIEFNNVADFFDAKDMKPAEFAKKLVNDYHLPAMQPNADHNGWQYDAPDGTRLQVLVREVFGIPVTRLVMSRTGN